MVACVNKMDLVDWDEDRFREIEARLRRDPGAQLGVTDARGDPDVGAARRQRRRDVRADARGTTGRRCSRQLEHDRGRPRPQPRRRPLPRPVGRARDERLPRLRGPDGRRASCDPATRSSCSRAASARRSSGSTRSTGPSSVAFPPMSVIVRLGDDLDVGRGERDLRRRRPAAGRPPSSTRRSAGWPTTPLRAGAPLPAQAHDPARAGDASSRSTRAWTSTRCATAARPTELELNDIGARAPATSPRR